MPVFKITPVPKNRQTQRDRWAPSDATLRYRAFADHIRLLASKEKFELPEAFYVKFTIPMPLSWSNKKKAEMEGKPHKPRPDLSNLLKALEDSLMEEDSKIHTVHMSKVWGYEGQIFIEPLHQ